MNKLFDVTQEFNGRPYRVSLGTQDDKRELEWLYLTFCLERRTREEVKDMFTRSTKCPPDRIDALRMTVGNGLFLGRFGKRMLDNNWGKRYAGGDPEPFEEWTTDHGKALLAEYNALYTNCPTVQTALDL